MEELNLLQRISVWVIPVLFAITVHEVAHGWMANRLGDPTARMLGRITLNPFKHIDPIGTILVPGLLLIAGVGFVFGWAKPVPVTPENLRSQKRDMVFVALAGPLANLVMAALWALVIKLGLSGLGGDFRGVMVFLSYVGAAGVLINVVLMVLNLLPLPPLDGGRVLSGLLPGAWSIRLDRIEPYGLLILLTLMVTGLLGHILMPPVNWALKLITLLAGIPEGMIY
jgi:Zn-dependent protease